MVFSVTYYSKLHILSEIMVDINKMIQLVERLEVIQFYIVK